jgi:hypothetical protein
LQLKRRPPVVEPPLAENPAVPPLEVDEPSVPPLVLVPINETREACGLLQATPKPRAPITTAKRTRISVTLGRRRRIGPCLDLG